MSQSTLHAMIHDTVFDTIEIFKAFPIHDTIRAKIINQDSIQYINRIGNTDLLPIIISGIIGILALIVSFYILRSNQKHHKLSAEPFLHVNFNSNSVSIINKGIGPAIIQGFDYTAKNNRRVYLKCINMDTPLKEYTNELDMFEIFFISAFTKGAYIGINESVELVKFDFKQNITVQIRTFETIMKEIDFIIHYKTLYGEKRLTKSSNNILTQIHEPNK